MTKKRIAVVEDDRSISAMYVFKLQSQGYEVRSAYDGDEGFKMVKEFKPDLILLDLKMPVMSGEEMLAKMRQTDWGSSIRVIVLTNISKDEAPMNLRFLNVDRYIVKAHHTPSQVVDVIREVTAHDS